MRGATFFVALCLALVKHFNSHSPCGARRHLRLGESRWRIISTHTPHAGRDRVFRNFPKLVVISTHTPHAGRDNATRTRDCNRSNFNSHAPCGARHRNPRSSAETINFNSHASCGARLARVYVSPNFAYFNSHAPCGARLKRTAVRNVSLVFQLTRPMRGATTARSHSRRAVAISTHTPHAGRDVQTRLPHHR